MDAETEFLSNLQGSAAANILTACFFLIFWVLKNKCKHSKCKSHTRFCDCSVKEDDEGFDLERGQRCLERKDTLKISDKVEGSMRKLHISKHHGILPKRSKTVPTD